MLKRIVKNILTNSFKARNDDTELMLEYFDSIGLILTPMQREKAREYRIGSVDLDRKRRQLVQEYPELQATERVKKGRKSKEKQMYNEYSTNKAFNLQ